MGSWNSAVGASVRQLGFSFVDEPPVPGTQRAILTSALRDHPSRRRILRMVRIAVDFFPELETSQIRIGLARGAQGYASLGEPAIWLNPRQLSYQTIAHELVHLLQARRLVPHGERSCDLYSLARSSLLNDAAPFYLQIPESVMVRGGGLRPGAARMFLETAREAIRLRASGERRYIRWFERRIEAWGGTPIR